MSSLDAQRFTETATRITSWRRPLLVTHEKPDGDALGALFATRALLQSQGIHATPILFDSLPPRYEFLRQFGSIPVLDRDVLLTDLPAYDAVIMLDTCAYNQVRPIADWLRTADQPKLAVDHHVTRDDLADFYLVDEEAAATCLILHDWARAANWPIDGITAETLFIGMAMDTGWFRHANTDHRVLAAAADLTARGVRPHESYEALFLRESSARVRLQSAAVATMELLSSDRAAIMTLTRRAVADAGATVSDTEDIVNEPLRIASVVVAVLLVEHDDEVVRVSFRSKPPPAAAASTEASSCDIDVAALAQRFGGGGHKRASGARIHGSIPDVRRRIVECIVEQLPAGVDSNPR